MGSIIPPPSPSLLRREMGGPRDRDSMGGDICSRGKASRLKLYSSLKLYCVYSTFVSKLLFFRVQSASSIL